MAYLFKKYIKKFKWMDKRTNGQTDRQTNFIMPQILFGGIKSLFGGIKNQ